MSLLPPVGWADVATKRDLDSFAALTTRDLDALGNAFRREMADLRGDLKAEIAGVRAEFHRDLATLTRTMVISLVTAVVAVASLAFAAARLV